MVIKEGGADWNVDCINIICLNTTVVFKNPNFLEIICTPDISL
jgi:hypothetical protein